MTTIAFKDGILAADTLKTSEGYRAGYGSKIHRVGRLLIGSAGSCPYYETFRDWVKGGLKGEHPIKKDIANLFVIMPDGRTVNWCDDGPFIEVSPYWALGTGACHAEGAMAAGASAAEAVRIAIQHDTRSGGDVETLALEPPKRHVFGRFIEADGSLTEVCDF